MNDQSTPQEETRRRKSGQTPGGASVDGGVGPTTPEADPAGVAFGVACLARWLVVQSEYFARFECHFRLHDYPRQGAPWRAFQRRLLSEAPSGAFSWGHPPVLVGNHQYWWAPTTIGGQPPALGATTSMLRSIAFIKSVHILIGIVLNGGLAVLLYEVIVDKITILTWIAVALFLIEGVVLVANGWKCPLTSYAERLGSTHGQVTDIFLPKWFADRFFQICGALWAVALLLVVVRLLT